MTFQGTHCVVDDLAYFGDTHNLELYSSDGFSLIIADTTDPKPYQGILLEVNDHLKYLCKAEHYPQSDRDALPDFKVLFTIPRFEGYTSCDMLFPRLTA